MELAPLSVALHTRFCVLLSVKNSFWGRKNVAPQFCWCEPRMAERVLFGPSSFTKAEMSSSLHMYDLWFVRVGLGYSPTCGAVVFRGKGGGWRSRGCLWDSGCSPEGTHWASKGAIRGVHTACRVVDLKVSRRGACGCCNSS